MEGRRGVGGEGWRGQLGERRGRVGASRATLVPGGEGRVEGVGTGSKPAEGCNHPPPGRGGWYPGPRTDQYLKHREVSSRYFRCPNVAGNEGVKNIYIYIHVYIGSERVREREGYTYT